jgi:hypothetical protein
MLVLPALGLAKSKEHRGEVVPDAKVLLEIRQHNQVPRAHHVPGGDGWISLSP